MTPADREPPRRRMAVAAAALVTTLDGFDAFSFNLAAPLIMADRQPPTALLGPLFASVMAGMILGATVGGALADKVGRLRILAISLGLFGIAALAMPFVSTAQGIVVNRLIAGTGLGAAAPIVIGLLNRGARTPPSALVIAAVMAGIPFGGCLASLFNFAIIPANGWKSIFLVGGLLPIPVLMFALWVFRGTVRPHVGATRAASALDVFRDGQGRRAAVVAAMFFGYVITAIFSNWLPTILHHRSATPLVISVTFAALNVGSVLGMLALGLVAARTKLSQLVPIVWAAAAAAGLLTLTEGLGTSSLAVLAIAGYTIGAGGQALSVALVNDLYRARGIETTAIGLMIAAGRLGQASALGATGLVISRSGREELVFALAGTSGLIAAVLGVTAVRTGRR